MGYTKYVKTFKSWRQSIKSHVTVRLWGVILRNFLSNHV